MWSRCGRCRWGLCGCEGSLQRYLLAVSSFIHCLNSCGFPFSLRSQVLVLTIWPLPRRAHLSPSIRVESTVFHRQVGAIFLSSLQMSILNKSSISPGGQPAFPLKLSEVHNANHHHPTSLPLHGTHTKKPLQPSSTLKRITPTISPGDTGESPSKAAADGGFVRLKRCTERLSRLLADAERAAEFESLFAGPLLQLEEAGLGLETDAALAVSVSSAVELDEGQVDLIARKMRRITGFPNLRMENTIDPSLIAGFVISYGDDPSQVIDLSVKSRLANLAARVESSDEWVENHGERGWNVL